MKWGHLPSQTEGPADQLEGERKRCLLGGDVGIYRVVRQGVCTAVSPLKPPIHCSRLLSTVKLFR